MDLTPRPPDMRWLLFSPSGRVGRQVYMFSWLFWLMLASFLLAQLIVNLESEPHFSAWLIASFIFSLVSAVSIIMLTVKRLHDMGWPGLLAVLIVIPAVSMLSLLAFCFWPSNDGPNRYGQAPNRPQ